MSENTLMNATISNDTLINVTLPSDTVINAVISNDMNINTTISSETLINTVISNDLVINTTIPSDTYINAFVTNDSEIKVSITSEGIRGADGRGLEYSWQGTYLGVKTSDEEEYTYVNLASDTSNGGVETFVFTQQASSSVWSITHLLNKYPSVTVVDSAGSVVIGEITYLNLSTISITFTSEFSGKAYLN